MQGLILSYDYIGKGRLRGMYGVVWGLLVWFVVFLLCCRVGCAGLSYLLEGRALAPCRVSAPAGHGHSIHMRGRKCMVF